MLPKIGCMYVCIYLFIYVPYFIGKICNVYMYVCRLIHLCAYVARFYSSNITGQYISGPMYGQKWESTKLPWKVWESLRNNIM